MWYIYIENLVGGNKIDTLQNYCQEHFGNYFSLRTFLKSLAPVEREKRKLEQKFAEVLKMWNCTKIALPEEEKNKFCYIFLVILMIFVENLTEVSFNLGLNQEFCKFIEDIQDITECDDTSC